MTLPRTKAEVDAVVEILDQEHEDVVEMAKLVISTVLEGREKRERWYVALRESDNPNAVVYAYGGFSTLDSATKWAAKVGADVKTYRAIRVADTKLFGVER